MQYTMREISESLHHWERQ